MIFTLKDQLVDHLNNLHTTFERTLSKDDKYINSMIYDYFRKPQDRYQQYNHLLLDNPNGNFFDYTEVMVGKKTLVKQKKLSDTTCSLVKYLEVALILEDFVPDVDLDDSVNLFYTNELFGRVMVANYFSNKKDKDHEPLPKLYIKSFIGE